MDSSHVRPFRVSRDVVPFELRLGLNHHAGATDFQHGLVDGDEDAIPRYRGFIVQKRWKSPWKSGILNDETILNQ